MLPGRPDGRSTARQIVMVPLPLPGRLASFFRFRIAVLIRGRLLDCGCWTPDGAAHSKPSGGKTLCLACSLALLFILMVLTNR